MGIWETIFALLLLSLLILTIVSFFIISLIEGIREGMRGSRIPRRAEMIPEYLEELLNRRRRRR